MRRAVAVLWAAGVLLGACGCAQLVPEVCPAIGWINGLDVDVSAYGDGVFVQLCVDGVCSPAPDAADDEAELIPVVVGDAGVWSFSMVNGDPTPDAVVVRVFEPGGELLVESAREVAWAASTDRCGGPAVAEPIVVSIP